MTAPVSTAHLIETMQDARSRTLELVHDLDDEQLMGPKLPSVNPLRWEIGHVAHFYEYFILRQLYKNESALGERADQLYDSITINHDLRWDLPLPTRAETLAYMQTVFNRLAERLDSGMATEQDSFIYQFGIFHEDMHTEAGPARFYLTRYSLLSHKLVFAAHRAWTSCPARYKYIHAQKSRLYGNWCLKSG